MVITWCEWGAGWAPQTIERGPTLDPNQHKWSLLRLLARFCASVMTKRIRRVGSERVWGGFEVVMVYILTRRVVLVC